MAGSWAKLVDDKLEAEFNRKGPDPRAGEKLRAKLLQSIETAKRQFQATEPAKGKKMFKVNNSVVAFSPTIGGNALSLAGKTTLYMPSERFPDFLDALSTDVREGKLDELLEQSMEIGSIKSGTPAKRVRAPMTDEARENMRRAAQAREARRREGAAA